MEIFSQSNTQIPTKIQNTPRPSSPKLYSNVSPDVVVATRGTGRSAMYGYWNIEIAYVWARKSIKGNDVQHQLSHAKTTNKRY